MGDLNTPMSSRPWQESGRGGDQEGLKDSVAVPAHKTTAVLTTPMHMSSGPSVPTAPATASGPVGMQVTEDLQGSGTKQHQPFPTGTSSPVSSGGELESPETREEPTGG